MQIEKVTLPSSIFTELETHWHRMSMKWKSSLQISFNGKLSHGRWGE